MKSNIIKKITSYIFLLLLINLETYSQGNTPCAASAITANATCITTAGTTAGATYGSDAANGGVPSCASPGAPDVWYSFTPTVTATFIITTGAGTITDGGLSLYSATSCGVGMTELACNDDGGPNSPMSQITQALTSGVKYYIRVWDYSSGTGTFNICIQQAPPPPANDNCAGATVFPAIPTTGTCSNLLNQSTSAATDSGVTPTGACTSNSGTPDDDVWFSFTATSTSQVLTATWVSGDTDVYWQVFSGACGGSMTSLLCTDTDAGGTITGLTINNVYYIRLYTYFSSGTTVQNICLSAPYPPPANDNPCSATAVPVNTVVGGNCTLQTPGTIAGATASGLALGSCSGTADDDVYFSFVASNATQNISLTNVAGSVTDMYFSVHAGACGSLGAALLCSDPNSGTVSGLTVGTTYYVRVYTYTSTSGQTTTFSVCISTPNACGNASNNDFCSNPATLTQGAGTFSSTTSGLYTADTPGNLNSTFCGSIENNSWYYFTANATTETFPITSVTGCANNWGVQAEVFAVSTSSLGCCTNYTSVSNCFNPGTNTTGTVTATGLTIGAKYILMFDGNAGDVCNFTVSGWTATGILPLELLTFVGQNVGEKNKVEWVTATEQNTAYFTLEKSKDAYTFEKTLDVPAAGNSLSPKNYKTFDLTPFEEITYYRLKMFDLDGTYEYSNIISIDNKNLTDHISNVHPNPTSEIIEFDIDTRTKNNVTIEVYDNMGKMISSEKYNLEIGNTSIKTNLENYKSGIYLLKVLFEASGKTEIQKIIKN